MEDQDTSEILKDTHLIRSTEKHVKLVQNWLHKHKSESRSLEDLTPLELNEMLSEFFLKVTKEDGSEYSWHTIQALKFSVRRYLKDWFYPASLYTDLVFQKTRDAIKAKRIIQDKKIQLSHMPQNFDTDCIIRSLVQENRRSKKQIELRVKIIQRWLVEYKSESRLIESIAPEELDELLSECFLKIKKQDGQDYSANSLVALRNAIDAHLKDKDYPVAMRTDGLFQKTCWMVERRAKELSEMAPIHQVEDAINDSDLSKLRETGQLGISTPLSLQFSIFYFLTKGFGLKGRDCLRDLKYGDVVLRTSPDGTQFLELQQINPNASGRDKNQKIFSTSGDPATDPVEVYKLFISKRPELAKSPDHPFFLKCVPLDKIHQQATWYYKSPMGVNTLGSLTRMCCLRAGISGRKTNRSLLKSVSGSSSIFTRQGEKLCHSQCQTASKCLLQCHTAGYHPTMEPDKEETILRETGLLGILTPESLRFSVFYYFTKGFGLKSRNQNRELKYEDVVLQTSADGRQYLELTSPDFRRCPKRGFSKCNEECIASSPKIFSTSGDPETDPVEIFKLYNARKPEETRVPGQPFYLICVPEDRLRWGEPWYNSKAAGVNTLGSMLNKARLKSGITHKSMDLSADSDSEESMWPSEKMMKTEMTGGSEISGWCHSGGMLSNVKENISDDDDSICSTGSTTRIFPKIALDELGHCSNFGPEIYQQNSAICDESVFEKDSRYSCSTTKSSSDLIKAEENEDTSDHDKLVNVKEELGTWSSYSDLEEGLQVTSAYHMCHEPVHVKEELNEPSSSAFSFNSDQNMTGFHLSKVKEENLHLCESSIGSTQYMEGSQWSEEYLDIKKKNLTLSSSLSGDMLHHEEGTVGFSQCNGCLSMKTEVCEDESLCVSAVSSTHAQNNPRFHVDSVVRDTKDQSQGQLEPAGSDSEDAHSVNPSISWVEEDRHRRTLQLTNQDIKKVCSWLQENKSETRPLEEISPEVLSELLSQYFWCAKKQNGMEFGEASLYRTRASIERYLRDRDYPASLTMDKVFQKTRDTIKAKKALLKKLGLENARMVSEKVNDEDEAKLRETGQLGISTPNSLLFSVFYYFAKGFGLRGRDTFRELKYGDFRLGVSPDGTQFIELDAQNNKNVCAKWSKIFSTKSDPCSDPVELFKLYDSKRPPGTKKLDSAFFLSCVPDEKLKHIGMDWYYSTPMGKNTLGTLLKTACSRAGITGRKTNLSLVKS